MSDKKDASEERTVIMTFAELTEGLARLSPGAIDTAGRAYLAETLDYVESMLEPARARVASLEALRAALLLHTTSTDI